jgi:phenylalanyl-tRNA synthetase alpha chain
MSFDYSFLSDEAGRQIEACADAQALEALRVKYLGRKGVLQEFMAKIPTLPAEERRAYGAGLNELKKQLTDLIDRKEAALRSSGAQPGPVLTDATLPGKRALLGRRHPLTQVESEICEIFRRLGFKVFKGPEVETEFHNFEALNIPLEHPSRDAFDTFYITSHAAGRASQVKDKERLLLRSHTSPAQIRALKACRPPLAVVVPGRVFRPDAVDASHSFMFHQVEGIAVDTAVRFSDLKGVLIAFAQEMFGPKTRMRFRPSFFPFTEPSAEVDVSCFICAGAGCSVCKKSGWLEILGCGMVHPHVFASAGYDTEKWRGFAFGMGVERIAMLKFGIHDIRLFFENDLRFLEQF